jgi:hypothetical protein
LRLAAPNLAEAFVGIQKTAEGTWAPVYNNSAEGVNLATSDISFDTSQEAWEAAFEVYREQLVV